jgi:hypothetical protein
MSLINNIFDKESFTLKELCNIFLLNRDFTSKMYVNNDENSILLHNLNNISLCYLNFTSNNEEYRKYLTFSRNNKGFLYKTYDNITNREYDINYREILQIADLNFTKLMIKISIDSKNYDKIIKWIDLENNLHGFKKDEFQKYYFEKYITYYQ